MRCHPAAVDCARDVRALYAVWRYHQRQRCVYKVPGRHAVRPAHAARGVRSAALSPFVAVCRRKGRLRSGRQAAPHIQQASR